MNIDEFMELDKSFNPSVFINKADNIFVKLFTAVMLNELDNVKHFISEDVYKIYQEKIDVLDKKGQRQMYDELNVKNSIISAIDVIDSKYVIDVNLTARYMDYVIDLNSGEKVCGMDDRRIEVNYHLRFIRDIKVLQQGIVRRCSSCGAPMDINNSGRCSYCGSIYNLEDYDWILDSIK